MFVRDDIDRLLREGRLRVWYSFLPQNNTFEYVGEKEVRPDEPDNPATRLFDRHYFGDRLRLTLGPIVKSHGSPPDPRRVSFKQFRSCYDLREMGGHIRLAPHEVISIQTNERIALGPNLGALVLPRLTTADSGLLYVPSYIDPYWDGLLQGVIVNLTDERQSLRVGEGVAICRFYELSDAAPKELASVFPAKSHHYGNNWPRILEEDADPFPVRKRPLAEDHVGFSERTRRFLNRHKRTLQQLGVTGGAIFLIFAAGTVYVRLSDLVDLNKRVDSLEHDVSASSKLVQELRVRRPLTGLVSVAVPQGEVTVTARVRLSRRLGGGSTSWASAVGRQSGILSLSSRIENDSGSGTSTLVLVLSVSPEDVDRVIPLQWLVVE